MASWDPASGINFFYPASYSEGGRLGFLHLLIYKLATLIGQPQQAKQPRVVVWNNQVRVEFQSLDTLQGKELDLI